ncbi:MAG: glycosyltransferase, partial [Acidobacteriota bacterium]|nr:glycosyltransferase [Acidobacteriota bacterium]
RLACQRAQHVIAVSEYVKNFLTVKWSIPKAKIGVVPHGVELPVAPHDAVRPKLLPMLEQPFFFTAGSLRPARGLQDAIQALASFNKTKTDKFYLVIGGAPTTGMDFYHDR